MIFVVKRGQNHTGSKQSHKKTKQEATSNKDAKAKGASGRRAKRKIKDGNRIARESYIASRLPAPSSRIDNVLP